MTSPLTRSGDTIGTSPITPKDPPGSGASVSDAAYGAGWNGDTAVAPSKNAVYDKIETLGGGSAHVIKDETISLTARTNLNFTGAGVVATDNAGTNSTDVTIDGGYTDEQAQDAVGTILADTAEVNLTYADATPAISADLINDSIVVGRLHATATNVFFGRDTAAAGAGEEIGASAARTILNVADGANNYVHPNHSGDVTSVADGAQTIAAAAVTLAKMANLAQDQFIGRVTASTGVPETATITAAARTALDDTTVAAMVDTLGGAASTGTGGLVRATSPTLVTPLLGTPTSGNLQNCTGLLVPGGGTGATTFADGAVLIGQGGDQILTVAPGAAGGVLVSQGVGVAPAFTTVSPAGLTSAARRRTRICRIDSPVSGDAFQVVGIPDAATIKAVRHIHVGGTSVVFNIEHRAEATPFTTSATVVWTAPGKTTSATSTEETAFDDGTVAASIVLTVVIGTVTGSVTNMLVVIEYEVD
jgi:hypothetical protein